MPLSTPAKRHLNDDGPTLNTGLASFGPKLLRNPLFRAVNPPPMDPRMWYI